MSEETTKSKAKLVLTARIKRAGTDEWIDLGELDKRDVDTDDEKDE